MNADLSIESMALEERKFLHDISNHIVVAQGMTSIVLKTLKETEGFDVKTIERQQKALDAINAQVKLIKERRNLLHTRS